MEQVKKQHYYYDTGGEPEPDDSLLERAQRIGKSLAEKLGAEIIKLDEAIEYGGSSGDK